MFESREYISDLGKTGFVQQMETSFSHIDQMLTHPEARMILRNGNDFIRADSADYDTLCQVRDCVFDN